MLLLAPYFSNFSVYATLLPLHFRIIRIDSIGNHWSAIRYLHATHTQLYAVALKHYYPQPRTLPPIDSLAYPIFRYYKQEHNHNLQPRFTKMASGIFRLVAKPTLYRETHTVSRRDRYL